MKKTRPRPTAKSTLTAAARPTTRHRKSISPEPSGLGFSGRMITPSFSNEDLEPDQWSTPPVVPPPTMPTFEQSLMGTPIPIHGNRSRIEVELGDITTRLNQTLTEFEKYDEPEAMENSMLDDVTSYINGMPSGPIKFQLKQLLSNYKDMSQKIDSEKDTDNDEMMASLAEWFMDEMGMEEMSAMEPDDLMTDLQDSLKSTKIGFEKLKMLNRKIVSSKGQNNIDQVKSDKTTLQNKVVSRFKTLFNNKKIKDIKANRTVHWKYASNEIVSLLQKVRTEGVSSIAVLEEQLENVIQVLENQAKTVSKVQSQLKDKDGVMDEMERKQSELEGEIMLLVDEREKLRDRVRRLIKKLKAARRNVVVEDDTEDDAHDEAFSTQNSSTPPFTPQSKVYARDRNVKPRYGARDTSTYDSETYNLIHDINDPSLMIDTLTDKILSLEKQIIQKEMRVMKIENNYHELADVVKKSAPNIVASLSFDLDTQEFSSESNTKSFCQNCDAQFIKTKAPSLPNSRGKPTPVSFENTEKVDKLKKDNEALRAECARVRSELDASRARLAKTKWELITLRYVDNKATRLPAPFSADNDNGGGQEGDEKIDTMYEMTTDGTSKKETKKKNKLSFKGVVKKMVAPIQMQVRTPTQLFITQERNATYTDEFEAYASVMKQAKTPVRQLTMSRVKQGGSVTNSAAPNGGSFEVEEISLAHQGVQTDPAMDPLGAWSSGIDTVNDDVKRASRLSVKLPMQSHSLPAPPTEWENFDPTSDAAATMIHSVQIESFPEPDQLRNNNEVITFVERELERMVQGIIGFTEYLNAMIEKETDSLTSVNKKIRKALSERTIMAIDQKLNRLNRSQQNEDGRGLCLKSPTRVGRFELASNVKPSRYANNRHFASYSFGKRKIDEVNSVQPVPTEIKYTSPVPLTPWYNVAQTHIQTSEAAAKSKRDSINIDDLDVSDLLKKQVTMIGEHAISVLRGTCLIFKESFDEQIKEYSELHDACSNKIPEWKKNIAASIQAGLSKDIMVNPLVLKSSSSERKINESKGSSTNERKSCVLRSTQSLSSIESSHRYLPSLLVHKNLDNTNRPEMKIPKAVIPRKGTIMLNTSQVEKDETKTTDKGYDEKKRHKPAPISHKRLMTKQREMLGRVYKPPDNIPEQELMNGPRTVLELSQQIVEFKRKNTRDLPPLPGRRTAEKTNLSDESTTKDKLLMHS